MQLKPTFLLLKFMFVKIFPPLHFIIKIKPFLNCVDISVAWYSSSRLDVAIV